MLRVAPASLARFGAVLLLQFGLLCWLVAFGHSRDSSGLLDLTGVVIPVCAIAVATDNKRQRRIAFGLAILAMVFSGGALSGFRLRGLDVGPWLTAGFSAYATWIFLGRVLRSRSVTGDVLAGAVAAYIMAGLAVSRTCLFIWIWKALMMGPLFATALP